MGSCARKGSSPLRYNNTAVLNSVSNLFTRKHTDWLMPCPLILGDSAKYFGVLPGHMMCSITFSVQSSCCYVVNLSQLYNFTLFTKFLVKCNSRFSVSVKVPWTAETGRLNRRSNACSGADKSNAVNIWIWVVVDFHQSSQPHINYSFTTTITYHEKSRIHIRHSIEYACYQKQEVKYRDTKEKGQHENTNFTHNRTYVWFTVLNCSQQDDSGSWQVLKLQEVYACLNYKQIQNVFRNTDAQHMIFSYLI